MYAIIETEIFFVQPNSLPSITMSIKMKDRSHITIVRKVDIWLNNLICSRSSIANRIIRVYLAETDKQISNVPFQSTFTIAYITTQS